MTAALSVIAPGIHATVQDRGRFGLQALGVPVSGVLDPVALRLVNALVGNEPDTAVLEFLHQGPTLEVGTDSIRVAAGSCEIELLGEPARRLPPWQSLRLARGMRIRLAATQGSACGYLAVEGGFALASVLGSQSTYSRARIGGLEGRVLAVGDELPLARAAADSRAELRLSEPPDWRAANPIRVVLGPQDDYFSSAAVDTFLSEIFTVSKDADRMGLRLNGRRLSHARGYDIISDGVATGAIQVPGSGHPIVMLADHQTTGGYPKIATVISTDLPAVGRLRPGDSLRFRAVSTREAEAARRARESELDKLIDDMVSAAGLDGLNESALYANNLVSGIVDAAGWPVDDTDGI